MSAFSRSIDVTMDWLDTSSFEIRGTLKDNVHILNARFVLSFPGFVIEQASGEITGMPYPGYCQGAMVAIQGLVGQRIGRGFRKRAGEIVGGASSCNHLHTLVTNMAACAFQMNYVAAKQNPKAAEEMKKASDDAALRREMVLGWMPQLRNSCFVFSETADPLFQLTVAKKDDGSTLNFNEE